MNKELKRITTIITVTVFLCSFLIFPKADVKNHISSHSIISVSSENNISIPIYIENNTGFIGFGFRIEFPVGCLKNLSVSRGDVIKTGYFSDSISDATVSQGAFRVFWTGSCEITENGELFWLSFDVEDDSLVNEFSIRIIPLPDDCFNEQWQDVTFVCEDIIVSSEKNPSVTFSFLEKIRKIFNLLFEKLLPFLAVERGAQL